MNKRKKMAVVIVAVLVMALCIVNFSSSRAEAVEEPYISGVDVSGQQGDHVNIIISLLNNPGITSAVLDFTYNEEVLELTGVDDMQLLPGASMTASPELTVNPYRVILSIGTADSDKDGGLLALHFKIKDTAAEGVYPIQISYDEDDIYNTKLENVKFNIKNPNVTVKEEVNPNMKPTTETSVIPDTSTPLPIGTESTNATPVPFERISKSGDVNQSGDVDLLDVQLVLQYYLNLTPIPNEEVFVLADVNHDDSVDLQDVQMILQAYLGLITLDE